MWGFPNLQRQTRSRLQPWWSPFPTPHLSSVTPTPCPPRSRAYPGNFLPSGRTCFPRSSVSRGRRPGRLARVVTLPATSAPHRPYPPAHRTPHLRSNFTETFQRWVTLIRPFTPSPAPPFFHPPPAPVPFPSPETTNTFVRFWVTLSSGRLSGIPQTSRFPPPRSSTAPAQGQRLHRREYSRTGLVDGGLALRGS